MTLQAGRSDSTKESGKAEMKEKRLQTYMRLYNIDRGVAENLDNQQLGFEALISKNECLKGENRRLQKQFDVSQEKNKTLQLIKLRSENKKLMEEVSDLKSRVHSATEESEKLKKIDEILNPYGHDDY